MTYSTILKTSDDYVNSIRSIKRLTSQLSESIDHPVFAYRCVCVCVCVCVCARACACMGVQVAWLYYSNLVPIVPLLPHLWQHSIPFIVAVFTSCSMSST